MSTDAVSKPATRAEASRSLWLALMPGVFVVLWSTGFIGAKFGLPYIEPLTFLGIRFAIVAAILVVVALAVGAPWPRGAQFGHQVAAGLLLHGVYLGGVFASIHHGVEAGVSALITGIQPLLVALAAGPLLGETVTGRQWLGFLLGLGGVVLVVWEKLSLGLGTPFGMGLSVLALFGMTAGTLYQKKYCGPADLRSGNAIQFLAAAVAMLGLGWLIETMQVEWSGRLIFAMAWLIFVLSLGAITLLFILIRRGAASQVSSLMFLVPPCTAVIAWFLFDERLAPVSIGGMVLIALGVALVNVRR
jgi:drug/metabolite transporter (DMT)-like permease